ncbi:hypothetical protein LUZ60_007497 [Juncus effusus]|nr:hypothetical protein LUZ60_007497 [Juncus effusus]
MDWYWSEWSNKRIFDLKVFKPEKFRWTANDYIKQSELKKNYFNDDVLKIKCDICVVVPPELQDIPRWELGRSLDIVKHSSQCFQSGVAADVKFLVNGKTFLAHRWILAACSPFFRKVFLDTPIAEGEKIQEIVITEMKAVTFDSLLYFIYTDSMPTEEDSNSRESILMTQRLLVSAGRYKIHKLKSICVNKLCEGLTLDAVATTLVLAEEHNCTELREACVEFLLKNKNCVDRSLIDASDD